MKLENVREAYYFYTGKTSEIIRQLALAGIALVWIFKTGDEKNPGIAGDLLLPAILIVIVLTLDLLQYVAGSVTWDIFMRIKENEEEITEDSVFTVSKKINYPMNIFFWLKLIIMVTAYVMIIISLNSR